MALLKQGMAPQDIIKKILADDPDPGYRATSGQKAGRQFAVMNAKGEFAAHTGPEASTWAGDKQGKHCTAQGNILAGPAVSPTWSKRSKRARSTLTASRITSHIACRPRSKPATPPAATRAGKQSAAMIVVKKDGGVWLHNDVVLRCRWMTTRSRSKSSAGWLI
jgi:uncharacterized Ntn-hydrolase superfamily protein